jgi:hypothetical protein
MKIVLPPILLTSCIYVSDYSVKLQDPTLRINYTLESVDKWLKLIQGISLVICDGSGFDFSSIVKEKFPQAKIECLFFITDQKAVQYHGKGYGEGEIIKYAMQHSAYLKQADYFAKCTAKLWVENFQECLNGWNGKFLCRATFSNVFSFKKTTFDHIDTRFYLVSKDFYYQYLSSAHLDLGGTTGMSIEDVFRDVVLNNKMENVLFTNPPLIGGVGGGTGKYYNNSMTKKIKEILRVQVAKNNPSFRFLFNATRN